MPSWSVLVADDHAAVRRLIVRALERPGRRFLEAEDGPRALAAWREWAFSLLILDQVMPRVTGVEIAREVRSAGDLTPILLISGAFDERVRGEADVLGGVICLSKPFALDDLRRPVERLLAGPSEGPDLRLGALALRRGLLTKPQVERALSVQRSENPRLRLGHILLAEGFLRKEQIDALLEKQRTLQAELRE